MFKSMVVSLGVCWVLPLVLVAAEDQAADGAVWLDSLDLGHIQQEWGSPRAGQSVEKNPLAIGNTVFEHGIGSHANGEITVELGGQAVRFEAMVGVDDDTDKKGTVGFEVWVDDKLIAETGVMRGGDGAKKISVDLTGAKVMILVATDGGDGISYDHADWADARIMLKSGASARPRIVSAGHDEEPPKIAHGAAPAPRINGPRAVGTTPGKPFIFLIPATGAGKLAYAVRNLPEGLELDTATGIITGTVAAAGRHEVEVTVKNDRGTAQRKLTIIAGEGKLALTPPMGWNSWNVWACAVDDAKIRAAADAMISSGLAAHGFQYINIDDCWEAGRDATGEILTNEKFPDMKALGDYVHSRGLRFGIYSSPGPKTCANYEGSYQHEEQDAATWAKWGVDYIKYDWCSYGGITPQNPSLEDYRKPYSVMRAALDKCDRDIVYSLCQYGMGDVWTWGADVGGNLWRTTGDITDTWSSMAGIGFSQDKCSPHAGPGHWNDPDMLVVGKVGWGPQLHDSRLSKNEQITHITLWSLLAAPLLIGCDMANLDPFTIAVLSNDEVIDVDQDPLGKAATRKAQKGQTEVWARPLFDGTMAVGLFNRGRSAAEVVADWSDLGVSGEQPVRDLWQRKDLGGHSGSFKVQVPRHGAVLIKVGRPRGE